ncbi:hypothetical protein PA0729 [Candidatus Phytoplasma australiense]|uniref:Uncharacterized protein n=1 Tax=Phytoplasma australiense TaxID=59748 RepID=B1VAU0_PHYAS|nr:hypothetical protein PA0729 [Candidatus Phytoplasma australiense]
MLLYNTTTTKLKIPHYCVKKFNPCRFYGEFFFFLTYIYNGMFLIRLNPWVKLNTNSKKPSKAVLNWFVMSND